MAIESPKRVAVIGAGISGVVSAAHLLKEGIDVTVFERSSAAGGVWLYDKRKPLEPPYPSVLPSEAERYYTNSHSTHSHLNPLEIERLLHAPPGPCYPGLKNNVSTRLLETTLNPFPPGTPDFVSHTVLKEYIQATAQKSGVHDVVRYNSEVKNVWKSGAKWLVDTLTLTSTSNTGETDGPVSRHRGLEEFDAVIVASGHYHAPRIPDIPGLAAWKQRWPKRIMHSKSYRGPEEFAKGQNILLIGGAVSSTDIARELSPLAGTIYQSQRNGLFDLSANMLPPNAIRVDEVISFDDPNNPPSPSPSSTSTSSQSSRSRDSSDAESGVAEINDADQRTPIPGTVTLRSGRKICEIHHVILCTGYHITLPFLRQFHASPIAAETPSSPPSTPLHPQSTPSPPSPFPPTFPPPSPTTIITTGTSYHNLHTDIFYIPDPTLLFIGIPFFTATFTLFEFQAQVAAKVLAGKASLPPIAEMTKMYNDRVERHLASQSLSLTGRRKEARESGSEEINGSIEPAELPGGGGGGKSEIGKAFHSLRGVEAEYVNTLISWVNQDLISKGLDNEVLHGHTEKWWEARREYEQRIKELFEGNAREEGEITVVCR